MLCDAQISAADGNELTVVAPGSGAWLLSAGLVGCTWLPMATLPGPLPALLLGPAVLLAAAEEQEAMSRWSHHAAVTTLHALSGQAEGVDAALPGAPPGHRAEGGTENEMKAHPPHPQSSHVASD